MNTSPPLRDHVAVLILERAAALLAQNGPAAASMADIAQAAGVGRATLYRHFPTRDALLEALAAAAVEDLGDRLAEAGLDAVPVREAVARVCRAFVTTGGKYLALMRTGHKPTDPAAVDRHIAAPLRALFQRGADEGELRSDIAPVVELGGWGVYMPYHSTWSYETDTDFAVNERVIEVKGAEGIPDAISRMHTASDPGSL